MSHGKRRKYMPGTPLERFLSFIDRNGPIPEKIRERGPCWLWIGGRKETGYGVFWDGLKLTVPHRWVYVYYRGAIAPKMDLHHVCENRCCCNPWHVEPLPHKEHMHSHPEMGMKSGAQNRAKTVCINGHEYTPDNTYIDKRGYRHCRKCRLENGRRFYRKTHEQI